MSSNRLAHAVDEIERALHGGWAGCIAGNPDRKEQRVESSIPHSRNIDVAQLVPRPNVEVLVEQQALRRVAVRIDDYRTLVDLSRPRGHLNIRERLREHENRP